MDDLIFSSDAPSTDWIAANPSDFGYVADEGSNMTVETYPQSQEPIVFHGTTGDVVMQSDGNIQPPAKLPVGSFNEFLNGASDIFKVLDKGASTIQNIRNRGNQYAVERAGSKADKDVALATIERNRQIGIDGPKNPAYNQTFVKPSKNQLSDFVQKNMLLTMLGGAATIYYFAKHTK